MVHILKSVATPIVWVFALIILGLIPAKYLRKKSLSKLKRFLVLLGVIVLYIFSISPVSNLLVYSLECRYRLPSAEVLSTLNVVVLLDGGFYPLGELRKYPEAVGVTYSRLFNGVRVFKQSSARTLVLCGGDPKQAGETGANVMKSLAVALGVQEDRIVTETKSRNTMEHATELARLLAPTEERRIGLVTSALHMLRSERVFRKVFPGEIIVPIPVNYIYGSSEFSLESMIPRAGALSMSTCAVHEWIGMLWYSVRY